MKRITRKVLTQRFVQSRYSRWGRGSNLLVLECGHERRHNGSIPVPRFKLCYDCRDLADGAVVEWGPVHGIIILETWDADKQWPSREPIVQEGEDR